MTAERCRHMTCHTRSLQSAYRDRTGCRTTDMSHFYRLFTINDPSAEKCGIGFLGMKSPSGERWPTVPTAFWLAMEEVPLAPPWPHCRVLRAPQIPTSMPQCRYVFIRQPGVALPDVWSEAQLLLVSERAKKVLESCDDFGHEFIETEVLDQEGERLNEVPYYAMNVRRVLQIEELGGTIDNQYQMFCPDYLEKKYLPVVQHNPILKAHVESLPIWRHDRNEYVHYINEPTLHALEAAGITGLRPYSTYDGLAGEAIGRFE